MKDMNGGMNQLKSSVPYGWEDVGAIEGGLVRQVRITNSFLVIRGLN